MPQLCPSWLSCILYNPARKVFTNRRRLKEEIGIATDAVVLEVGTGNGFFTGALAERAKKVIAVELQPGMVRKLSRRLIRFGRRLEIIAGDIINVDIAVELADVCLLYFSRGCATE